MMPSQVESSLKISEDHLQFSSRGPATRLALDTFASAFAGSDPTSLHFARPDAAAQVAFWQQYMRGHILDTAPKLNFLAKGGQGAIVANLLPQQELGWLVSKWHGVRLLLAAVPLAKWSELDGYASYLAAKRHEFLQAHGSFVHIVLVGVRPEVQNQGIGTRLLRRVLRYADEHSLSSYVEASTERSRHLYLRLGFTDIETWHGGFPAFLMGRPPATGSGSGGSGAPSGLSGPAGSRAADVTAADGWAAPAAGTASPAAAAANAAPSPVSPPNSSASAAGVDGGNFLRSSRASGKNGGNGGQGGGKVTVYVAAAGGDEGFCADSTLAGGTAAD